MVARLFVQKLVQANSKENIKAVHNWPFVGEIPEYGKLTMVSLTKGP